MNNNDMDKLIKDSIDTSLNNLELRDEVFVNIKENIGNQEKRNNYKALKVPFSRLNSLKAAASIICIAVAFCSLSLVISPNARVFATDAIHAIKTIFVYDDKGQIVEKSQNDPIFTYGVSVTTTLNDAELEKKLGYKVVFPKSLSDNLEFKDKSIGVMLQKSIDYETGPKLSSRLERAATDDTELEGLKDYGPTRDVSAFYTNEDCTIGISVQKVSTYFDVNALLGHLGSNSEKIKIGGIEGIWSIYEMPEYPTKTEGGKGSADMTQKPTGKTMSYSVMWASGDLTYHVIALNGYKLTPEMGANIAKAFMKCQK